MSQLPGFSRIPHEQEVQEQDVVTLIKINPTYYQDPRYKGVYYEYDKSDKSLNLTLVTESEYEELDFSKFFLVENDLTNLIIANLGGKSIHVHRLIINDVIHNNGNGFRAEDNQFIIDILDVSFLSLNYDSKHFMTINIQGMYMYNIKQKVITSKPIYWYSSELVYDESEDDVKPMIPIPSGNLIPIESSYQESPIELVHIYGENDYDYGTEYPLRWYKSNDSEEEILYITGNKHYFHKNFKVDYYGDIREITTLIEGPNSAVEWSYSHLPSSFIGTQIKVFGKVDISDCVHLNMDDELEVVDCYYGTLLVSPNQFEALKSASLIVQRTGEDFYVWSYHADITERERYVKVVVKSE